MHENPEQASGQAVLKAPDPDQEPQATVSSSSPLHLESCGKHLGQQNKALVKGEVGYEVGHGMDSCVWSDARSYLLATENTEAKG